MQHVIHHPSLDADLEGSGTLYENSEVIHYRGIPYAKIPARFERATLIDEWGGESLDCTKFGPHCPQLYIDAGHLLRVPKNLKEDDETTFPQDEFNCLNINVSVPAGKKDSNLLPVLLWIHGGSQMVSYPPLAHRASDVTPLIVKSATLGKPIIVVTFNYRLNIFHFGDGGEVNLGLKDQRLAIQWVINHIEGFGGDKNNITLGGESAGAIFTHAHICTGVPVRRGILQSGSLHASPPMPRDMGNAWIKRLSWKDHTDSALSIRTESIENLLQQLRDHNLNTTFLQEEPILQGWDERGIQVEGLLVGDVEYETVIWNNGIGEFTAEEITKIFNRDSEHGEQLRELYGIYPDRQTSSKSGALDFINDVRYVLPNEEMCQRRRQSSLKTYQYLMDEPNPWHSSSRAHHAVDLIFLFGGYDISFNSAAAKVSGKMQEKWISFVHGEEPWDTEKRFAIGPYGKCGEIEDDEFAARRRARCLEVLKGIEKRKLLEMSGMLAAGRLSLHN
ncbi:carboxylic ester hydrolase-9 [Coleophoma crateriformis]|uniref:Carboxylic ester hydrolase n=1 Tax=Coleophoma crateriformis TaxID=565419 RepID=A0A3D8T1B3_9HELO|nr:carboxylic ester hydrolase-9 [Coleophoma crateriformis]